MRRIDDIHELVELIDLADMFVHEERARRVEMPEPDKDAEARRPVMNMGMRRDGRSLHQRFRIVMVDSGAEYVADYEAVYVIESDDEIEVATETLQEFASKVSFMAVYPFLRSSIFGGAARMGNDRPVLGMVRLGEFEVGEPMSDREVDSAFNDVKSELDRS